MSAKLLAPDEAVAEYLTGVVGYVEANSYERLCLWQEYTKELGKSWEGGRSGFLYTIGFVGKRPVCISLLTSVVDGHKILFWHATSQVVDYEMAERWLETYVPKSAFYGEKWLPALSLKENIPEPVAWLPDPIGVNEIRQIVYDSLDLSEGLRGECADAVASAIARTFSSPATEIEALRAARDEALAALEEAKLAIKEFGTSRVRDRVASRVGCNHDILHDALQREVARALQPHPGTGESDG